MRWFRLSFGETIVSGVLLAMLTTLYDTTVALRVHIANYTHLAGDVRELRTDISLLKDQYYTLKSGGERYPDAQRPPIQMVIPERRLFRGGKSP